MLKIGFAYRLNRVQVISTRRAATMEHVAICECWEEMARKVTNPRNLLENAFMATESKADAEREEKSERKNWVMESNWTEKSQRNVSLHVENSNHHVQICVLVLGIKAHFVEVFLPTCSSYVMTEKSVVKCHIRVHFPERKNSIAATGFILPSIPLLRLLDFSQFLPMQWRRVAFFCFSNIRGLLVLCFREKQKKKENSSVKRQIVYSKLKTSWSLENTTKSIRFQNMSNSKRNGKIESGEEILSHLECGEGHVHFLT